MTRHTQGSRTKKLTQEWIAEKLGVSREHLNRVLRGHRQSRSLRRRYRALLAGINQKRPK